MVQIVGVGPVGRRVLDLMAAVLADSLRLPCSIRDTPVDPEFAHDPGREQYNSTAILARLAVLDSAPGQKVLGIADVDLFIPILTFVFGEAQLDGRVCLISLRRLRQEFYGLPADEEILYQRAEKEAVHELGHTFGLTHCRSHECVMHFSNSIEEVDIKSNTFCEECLGWLRQRNSFPLGTRRPPLTPGPSSPGPRGRRGSAG